MCVEINIRYLDHVFQCIEGGSQEDIIVTVSIHTAIDTIDGTAEATVLEDGEEVLTVVTVGESSQDLPLADPIADSEAGGDCRVPSDIGELVDIHIYDDS